MIQLLSTTDVVRLVTSTDADIDVMATYEDGALRNWAGSAVGVFGTIGSITPPTSTTADKGPIGFLY